jgi:isopentenyl phosphate kinase
VSELVFVKLGGSLITDKTRAQTPRRAVIQRLVREVAAALQARPDLRLVLGHGSGSFGHFSAERFQVHLGGLEDWRGYAETGAAAQRLNRLVTDALLTEGVRAVSLQPSASARCRGGELVELAVEPVWRLLQHGAVPLVYGDVALDDAQGCTILSTEQILIYLAQELRPSRLLMVGEVAGVYTGDPLREPNARLVPQVAAREYAAVERGLTGSHGVDVTGGMASKVRLMCGLVQQQPELTVRILTGRRAGVLQCALIDPSAAEGTLIGY